MELPVAIEQTALGYLARRDHSVKELKDKLMRKFSKHPVETLLPEIESLIERFEARGYLDDQRFAQLFIESRVSRGYGPIKIRFELKQKGVEKSLVQSSMSELEVDWSIQAKTLRERRFGASLPTEMKDKKKQMRFLASRGFDYEHIKDGLLPDEELF
ncbi:MAG: regulatory protein RecX [Pseudomonadota bacterium]|nr:regulatory protein RecX [Pseudomonadota bacterium]